MTGGESESDLTFPEVNPADGLDVGAPKRFPVDPVSCEVAGAKEPKGERKAREKDKAEAEAEAEKNAVVQAMTSTLVVSGVLLAIIGVVFVVTKKLRET